MAKQKKEETTKQNQKISKVINFIVWLVGVLVSLSVGAGMATRKLTLELLFIPSIITVVAGWIVIIGTILGIVLSLFSD